MIRLRDSAVETTYHPGDRVVLLRMVDDPDPIAPGSTGTVTGSGVHDLGDGLREHVNVRWDDGRTLSLLVPPDVAEKIP